MRNPAVNLTKQVLTADGRRLFCPAVESANGRVKANIVVVDGREEHHPEGCYYIEWRDDGKRRRLSVGKDYLKAHAAKQRKESELAAISRGVAVVADPAEGRRSFAAAVADFLEEKKHQRKPKTHVDYESALRYFQQSCSRLYLEDITRKDLLAFAVYCREELKHSPRTVSNKFKRVVAFLRAHKIKVHETGDTPRFVREETEVYERADLDVFFAACDPEERLWFEFFLMTGMREQEVMHVCWNDIKFADSVVRVSCKPEMGWSPKAYKEREIPIPEKLTAALRKLQSKANGCPLVFPTAGCRPQVHFLDACKSIARRAGLNCGHCAGCKGKAKWCERWFLHKFRATFATWALWKGVDLRTVQDWMGHNDLESTMRYLKPSRSQQTREKVNEIFA